MAEQGDSLLQEVDDALRADRMAKLWQENKQVLLFAVIAVILATAGGSVWRSYQDKKAEAAMGQLDKAITMFQEGGRAQAATMFGELANSNSGERRDVALLWQAKTYEAMGDEAKAVDPLKQVAQGKSGDLLWRDLACLRLMGMNTDVPESCNSGDNSPLRPLRDEWRAGQLWHEGKLQEARALLAVIANGDDKNVTAAQRERANSLLAIMSDANAESK